MDIVGPIAPLSSRGYQFILIITDYFSKWAEEVPMREIKMKDVVKLIKHYVIYRLVIPRHIIHDNEPQFSTHGFARFCDKFRIQYITSTLYNSATNDLTKFFNKTIIKLLRKFVSSNRWDWDEKLGKCLWAYRTTIRNPTKSTPFSLVFH